MACMLRAVGIESIKSRVSTCTRDTFWTSTTGD
jgi:hypothetical protein